METQTKQTLASDCESRWNVKSELGELVIITRANLKGGYAEQGQHYLVHTVGAVSDGAPAGSGKRER